MSDIGSVSTGTLDSAKDAGPGPEGVVKRWLMELDLADAEEKFWREQAKDAVERYRDEKKQGSKPSRYATGNRFNILYSNVQTMCPALYNQPPKPDVRRRFRDADPEGKLISALIERGLSYTMDAQDFDPIMKSAVKDSQLPGRAVTRVRYEPTFADQQDPYTRETFQAIADEKVCLEHVQWDMFRRGPGKTWKDVPWIAFCHYLRKEDAEKMLGAKLPADFEMDYTPDGVEQTDQNEETVDTFKRLKVWEIWDKDARKVHWLAPGYKEKPLRTDDDPLHLEGFWPIPRPLYFIENTDSLVPTEPYRFYRDQAEELDEVTKRITKIIKVLKWRGIYAGVADEIQAMEQLDDGQLAPSESLLALLAQGGIEKAVWMMPIEQAAAVLQSLYLQREQIKQAIFEITGLADVMRGATKANETLGAQQLKAQFGTMRLDDMRREVQRYARDLVRLIAEVISEHFQPQTLTLMTGITVTPEIMQIMQQDGPRGFRIDIETDSTVAGDVAEEQRSMVEMLGGISTYVTAMGPAVQSGLFPMEAAKALLMSATRRFKMGREVEDSLDQIGGQVGPDGQPLDGQPQAAPQIDPALMAEQQAQAQAQQQMDAEAQAKQADMAVKQQEMALQAEMADREAARQHEAAMAKAMVDQVKADREWELRQAEFRLKERQAMLQERVHTDGMGFEREKVDHERSEKQAEKQAVVRDNAKIDALLQAVTSLSEMMAESIRLQSAPREAVYQNGRVVGVKIAGGPAVRLAVDNQ